MVSVRIQNLGSSSKVVFSVHTEWKKHVLGSVWGLETARIWSVWSFLNLIFSLQTTEYLNHFEGAFLYFLQNHRRNCLLRSNLQEGKILSVECVPCFMLVTLDLNLISEKGCNLNLLL